MYNQNYYKKNYFFVFTEYKNEHKECKFWQQKSQKKWLLQRQNSISGR